MNAERGGEFHGDQRSRRADHEALSPAYDLNPVPADLKARILSTNIDLQESTCSVDLLEASADYFALSLSEARLILKQVAMATSSWRAVALEVGAGSRCWPQRNSSNG
jgi:serine/threonine-protein kinase HipA